MTKKKYNTEKVLEATFKGTHKEYTLQEVIGDATLPDWVRLVIVAENGNVFGLEFQPNYTPDGLRISRGRGIRINNVVPTSFKNCIWEINVKPDCEYTLDSVIGDEE